MSAKSQPQPTTTDDKCLQSVPAVAKFLSLSRSKVYKLMDDGELPFVKLGKSRRIRWADVLKLVERNLVGAEE